MSRGPLSCADEHELQNHSRTMEARTNSFFLAPYPISTSLRSGKITR